MHRPDTLGPRLFGRELDVPELAVTVHGAHGETRVTHGPIHEVERFLAGLDVIECADLNAAMRSLVTRSPPPTGPRPYLLTGWIGPSLVPAFDDRAVIDAIEAWRRNLDARGLYLMGSSVGGVEAATTLALREPRTLLGDTPFLEIDGFRASIDVVDAANRQHAIDLAAAHPLATGHAIEVRPFAAE